jgi:hypothetical protein
VSLPGVQILLAFLLTVPFSQRFGDLDTWERRLFGAALVSSMLSVICLLTPALLHRIGERTARKDRLRWSIRLQVTGMGFLAIALITSLWSVSRFVFGSGWALWLTLPPLALILALWIGLPLSLRRRAPISDR